MFAIPISLLYADADTATDADADECLSGLQYYSCDCKRTSLREHRPGLKSDRVAGILKYSYSQLIPSINQITYMAG